jgi:NAD(P)-dependent dehydrogenase (short-subunit alcohol dehydrogenase family)
MSDNFFQQPLRTVQQMYDLTGRVAVITGGAGMLGRQHADAIAEAGGTVVIADIDGGRAKQVADQVRATKGIATLGVEMDVADKVSVEAACRTVLARLERIDILINNAAFTVKRGSETDGRYFLPFEDYPLDLWRMTLETNMTGAFLCSQIIGKAMLAGGRGGVVLNIASDVGVISPDHRIYEGRVDPYTMKPFNTPISYAASKAAIINMTRYLATWWAPKGIRVNSLSPAGVYEDHDADFVEQLAYRIPLGRMARRDEYKGAVLFLVSDASSFMTGANLIVDGGRTAW